MSNEIIVTKEQIQGSKTTVFKKGGSTPAKASTTSRERLNRAFLDELNRDFAKHGTKAIKEFREKAPGRYVELIASLLPQEQKLNVENNKFTHLDISVSATTEFIRDSLRGRADSSPTELVQNGPVLLATVRNEEAGHREGLVVQEVPGGSGEPEWLSGPVGERALQGHSGQDASSDSEPRLDDTRTA